MLKHSGSRSDGSSGSRFKAAQVLQTSQAVQENNVPKRCDFLCRAWPVVSGRFKTRTKNQQGTSCPAYFHLSGQKGLETFDPIHNSELLSGLATFVQDRQDSDGYHLQSGIFLPSYICYQGGHKTLLERYGLEPWHYSLFSGHESRWFLGFQLLRMLQRLHASLQSVSRGRGDRQGSELATR